MLDARVQVTAAIAVSDAADVSYSATISGTFGSRQREKGEEKSRIIYRGAFGDAGQMRPMLLPM